MRHFFVFGLIATLSLLSAPAVAQNLIVNGSFETPIVLASPPAAWTDVPVGSSLITGWTVFGPPGKEVAVISGAASSLGVTLPAQSGNQWLDLTGDTAVAAEGVQQAVTTVAGHHYQLSFYIGNTSATVGGGVFGTTSSVDVLINGVLTFTDTNSTPNLTSLTWQPYSHAFTATGASTTIAFRNADPNTDYNNALDNVVLVDLDAAVAPGTYSAPTLTQSAAMLLAGVLAWIGVARVRRARRRLG